MTKEEKPPKDAKDAVHEEEKPPEEAGKQADGGAVTEAAQSETATTEVATDVPAEVAHKAGSHGVPETPDTHRGDQSQMGEASPSGSQPDQRGPKSQRRRRRIFHKGSPSGDDKLPPGFPPRPPGMPGFGA